MKQHRKLGRKQIPFLFLFPAFIIHLCVVTLPSISTFAMSLYEWNGLGKPKFIGLSNFVEIFSKDAVIGRAIMNNLKWTAIFITIPIVMGFGIAVILSRIKKGQMFFRVVFFMPYVVSAVVAAKIWLSFFNPFYGFGQIFSKLGLDKLASVMWTSDPNIALYTVAFVDNWHWWGFVMVLFLGALQQIDPALYEAGVVDGTSKLQQLWYITIPGIKQTIVFIIITSIMWSFLTYDYVWIMTGGGPSHATEILSTWIYKNAFINYRSGYANALCVVQSGICIVFYFIQKYLSRKGGDEA
ncbi:sugar ABC transporter permease [Oscillospiraceae bacterium PP1C4]